MRKFNHSSNETLHRLMFLELNSIKELGIAHHKTGASHYIDDEHPNEMATLYNYLVRCNVNIDDYIEYANGPQFSINNHDIFMNCVKYCNTFDAKYLV